MLQGSIANHGTVIRPPSYRMIESTASSSVYIEKRDVSIDHSSQMNALLESYQIIERSANREAH